MLGLQYFTFEELWSPMFFFFMAALVILYFYLAGPWREKHVPEAARVTVVQKCLFVTGMVLYYMAQGGPLELLGHLMFSFHMTNMSISYLIVPPLIILGIPAFMWRKMFSHSFWRRFRPFMNPILSLVLFNMLFSIYHVPMVHDFVMTNFTVHRIYYLAMLVAAFMMWWQIVSPIPEWSRLSDVRKMAYVFANGMLLTPACALIIFTSSPMYATYNDPDVWALAMGYCVSGDPSLLLSSFEGGPSFFNLMKPIEDQQLGGIIMKFVQEIMYGGILAYIFFHWYRREHGETEDEIRNAGPAGAN